MAVGCVLAITGYIMLLVAKTNSVKYGGTFLVAAGVFPGSPMVIVSRACVQLLVLLDSKRESKRNESNDASDRAGCPTISHRIMCAPRA